MIPSGSERRVEIVRKIILYSLLLVLNLVFLEAMTRFMVSFFNIYDLQKIKYSMDLKDYQPEQSYSFTHFKSKAVKLMGVAVGTNSEGLRDAEVQTGASRRIVFLGECSTFGWGVKQAATFESLLDQSFKDTEIVNMAHCDYSLKNTLSYYQSHGKQWPHQYVVYFFFLRDLEDDPAPRRPSFWNRSQFLALVISRLHRYRDKKDYKIFYKNLFKGIEWQIFETRVTALNREVQNNGAKLSVVLIPDFHKLNPNPFSNEYKQVTGMLDAKNIDNLDLTGLFAEEKNSIQYWVALDDPHPNGKAHQRIFEKIKNWMENKFYPET